MHTRMHDIYTLHFYGCNTFLRRPIGLLRFYCFIVIVIIGYACKQILIIRRPIKLLHSYSIISVNTHTCTCSVYYDNNNNNNKYIINGNKVHVYVLLILLIYSYILIIINIIQWNTYMYLYMNSTDVFKFLTFIILVFTRNYCIKIIIKVYIQILMCISHLISIINYYLINE